jgi:hypothetical protein
MSEVHRSRNTMFWRRDERVHAASKHPGWATFHRACGKAGLFFDDIDPIGRGSDYGAVTFRVEQNRRGLLIRYLVANGRGNGPIPAVIDAYRNSIDAGFAVPAGLEALLADAPEKSAVEDIPYILPGPDLSELIGITDIDDVMGLIG